MKFMIMLLAFPLSLFAGPYRAIMYKFRTFGGLGTGLLTWVGTVAAIPAMMYGICLICRADPDRVMHITLSEAQYGFFRHFRYYRDFRETICAIGFWGILVAATATQMLARWCSKLPVRDRWVNHSWLGWGEFLCVALISGLGFVFSYRIVAVFLIVGYLCSALQLPLFRLHKHLAEKPRPEKAPRQMALKGAHFQQQVMPDGQVIYVQTRSPSFAGRVMSHMVASWLMSGLWWGLLSGKVLGVILAAPLWMLGWKVEAPMDVKEEGRHYMARLKEVVGDKREEISEQLYTLKESASDKLDDVKEEARTKVDGLKDDAREKAREVRVGLAVKRQEAKAEMEREARKTVWKALGF